MPTIAIVPDTDALFAHYLRGATDALRGLTRALAEPHYVNDPALGDDADDEHALIERADLQNLMASLNICMVCSGTAGPHGNFIAHPSRIEQLAALINQASASISEANQKAGEDDD